MLIAKIRCGLRQLLVAGQRAGEFGLQRFQNSMRFRYCALKSAGHVDTVLHKLRRESETVVGTRWYLSLLLYPRCSAL